MAVDSTILVRMALSFCLSAFFFYQYSLGPEVHSMVCDKGICYFIHLENGEKNVAGSAPASNLHFKHKDVDRRNSYLVPEVSSVEDFVLTLGVDPRRFSITVFNYQNADEVRLVIDKGVLSARKGEYFSYEFHSNTPLWSLIGAIIFLLFGLFGAKPTEEES